jgi:hypothetical protein
VFLLVRIFFTEEFELDIRMFVQGYGIVIVIAALYKNSGGEYIPRA